MVDFQFSWVQNGNTFNLSGDYTPEEWGEDEATNKIPSVELEGAEGEYQGDAYLGVRLVTVPFRLMAESPDGPDELRSAIDALVKALMPGPAEGPGKLYKHSDRYIEGRVAFIRREKDIGLNDAGLIIGLRCADPFWYASTTDTLALSAGANAITAGGGYPALPVFTFVCTVIGTITITHAGTGQSFILTLSATGTYVVDCAAGTVTKDGTTDAISMFSGEFLDEGLVVAASTITLGGTATLSDADVDWRKRWVTN